VKYARTVLCGGRLVRVVPTATEFRKQPQFVERSSAYGPLAERTLLERFLINPMCQLCA
jgi:hypothetical protein